MKKRHKKIAILTVIIIILFIIFSLAYIFGLLFQEQNKDPNAKGCLSLTFDDGLETQYNTAYPLLKERGFKASFFIITNVSSFEGKKLMNYSEILELKESGFEIGSHSLHHNFMTKINDSETDKEFSESKKILEEKGIIVDSFAFPYRDYNSKLLEKAKSYYTIVRDNYNINSGGFFINGLSIEKTTDINKTCNDIEKAANNNYWLILIIHDVSDSDGKYTVSKENFIKLLDCASKYGIKVESLKTCKEKSGILSTMKFFPFNIIKIKKIGY